MPNEQKENHGCLLVVNHSGAIARVPFNPANSLVQLQKEVGGYIEFLALRGPLHRFDAFCDDDGIAKGLPINAPITAACGLTILGNVVICKHNDFGDTIGLDDAEATEALKELAGLGASTEQR